MTKPKNKADWKLIASKLTVVVEDADTVKEIKKNIADKLKVSSRGSNFDKRLLSAIEKVFAPSPAEAAAPKASSTTKKKAAVADIVSKRDELQSKAQKLSADLDKKSIPADKLEDSKKKLNKMVNDIAALNSKIDKANG